MADINYINPTAPSADFTKTGALGGMLFAADRQNYEQQNYLQNQQQGMATTKQTGQLEDYFKTRDSKVGADIATNNATAETIGAEKRAGVRQTELGNQFNAGTMDARIGDTNLKHRIAKLDEDRNQVKRGLEMMGVLMQAGQQGPAAMAAVQQRIGPAAQNDPIMKYLGAAQSQPDLIDRLDKVHQVYRTLDMDYQKALLAYRAALVKGRAESRPGIWEQNRERLKAAYIRQNMSPGDAEEKATREIVTAQSGAQGNRLPTPESAGAREGQEQTAKAVVELEKIAAMLPPSSAQRKQILSTIETMKKGLGTASKPKVNPKALPIEQAREYLKSNDTPENRKYFEDTYGEKP